MVAKVLLLLLLAANGLRNASDCNGLFQVVVEVVGVVVFVLIRPPPPPRGGWTWSDSSREEETVVDFVGAIRGRIILRAAGALVVRDAKRAREVPFLILMARRMGG